MENNDSYRPIKTSKFITKFELARVIGMRLLQLKESYSECQEENGKLEKIVIQELIEGKNPCVIRRYLPNNNFEDCAVKNLMFDDDSQSFVLAPNRFQ